MQRHVVERGMYILCLILYHHFVIKSMIPFYQESALKSISTIPREIHRPHLLCRNRYRPVGIIFILVKALFFHTEKKYQPHMYYTNNNCQNQKTPPGHSSFILPSFSSLLRITTYPIKGTITTRQ